MAKASRGQTPANRQAKQERAQAAAMGELESLAEKQREKTNVLRKLRLEKETTDASSFQKWRKKKSLVNGN